MWSSLRRRFVVFPSGAPRDAGFGLVELMVALVVFGIAATGIAAAMITAIETTRMNRDRVQAANLASRELEITRSEFMNSTDGGASLAAASMVVNPHPLPTGTASALNQFTVTRNVQWIPAGTGTSSCDGGSTVTYPSLAVDVTVTWVQMENVRPIESHTVLTPPKGTLNSSLGFVGIKVLRSDGLPANGQAVTLTGPSTSSRFTAADGCAVFALSTPGTYTATLSTPGYVDNFGVSTPSKTVNVLAGQLTQASFSYDEAATLTVSADAPSGHALPATLPEAFQLYNSGIAPAGIKTVSSSLATTVVPDLWPFSDGYTLWPGTCTQSDPVRAGGSRAPNTVLGPGDSDSADLDFLPVTVNAVNNEGSPLALALITVVPSSSAGCTGVEASPWLIGVTGTDGTLSTSLPAGDWEVRVSGRSPDDAWPTTGSLVPGGATADVTVQISTLL